MSSSLLDPLIKLIYIMTVLILTGTTIDIVIDFEEPFK